MDEYLDEEIESLRNALELICRGWDKKVRGFLPLLQMIVDPCSHRFQSTLVPAQIMLVSFPHTIRLK